MIERREVLGFSNIISSEVPYRLLIGAQVIAARSETAGTDRFLANGFRAGIRRIIPTSSYQTRSDPSSSDGFHWIGFRHCLCRRSSDDFRHGFSRNFAGTSPVRNVPESGCKDPTGTGWNWSEVDEIRRNWCRNKTEVTGSDRRKNRPGGWTTESLYREDDQWITGPTFSKLLWQEPFNHSNSFACYIDSLPTIDVIIYASEHRTNETYVRVLDKRTTLFISHHVRLPTERFRSTIHTLPMYQQYTIFPSKNRSSSHLDYVSRL